MAAIRCRSNAVTCGSATRRIEVVDQAASWTPRAEAGIGRSVPLPMQLATMPVDVVQRHLLVGARHLQPPLGGLRQSLREGSVAAVGVVGGARHQGVVVDLTSGDARQVRQCPGDPNVGDRRILAGVRVRGEPGVRVPAYQSGRLVKGVGDLAHGRVPDGADGADGAAPARSCGRPGW